MHYNRLSLITIALLSMLFFCQCSKQLGDIKPKDSISQDQLSDNDIAKLRIGMYAQLENVMWTYWFDFDVRANQYISGPGGAGLSNDPVNMSPADSDIAAMWQSSFLALAKVNFLIETIDASPSAGSLAATKGEALFFRGLIYYNMVIRWGGLPILTSRTYNKVPRATETAVWAQIKNDLTTAETLVGNFTDRFYASKQAVQALLAKVYLATNDKQNAQLYANKVITSNKFALAGDAMTYASMFVAGSDSKELIFALANNTTASPHLFYQQLNDIDGTWSYSPTTAIYNNLYADKGIASGDQRKTAVFLAGPARITKFPNGIAGQQLATTSNAIYTPIVVLRIADMYLIKAEAEGKGSTAEVTLSPYFSARYKIPPVSGTIAGLSDIAFQDLILNERQREFYAEGYRWYDIKRTGRKDLLPELNGRDYLLYYPVPQTEKDLAGYTQNDGY